MKESILQLRSEGKSYRQIAKALSCNQSTVAYYCAAGNKDRAAIRINRLRRKRKADLVAYKGGKCEKCGYDKYIGALEFHHLDPSQKDYEISDRNSSFEERKKEADKCALLCCRCHREVHGGVA